MGSGRAVTPLIGIGVAYAGVPAVFLLLGQLLGSGYEHTDNLSRGLVFLGWAVLAIVAVTFSLTSLAFVFRDLRRWLRIATIAFNVPVTLLAPVVAVVAIWSLQDYSASYAAYDAVEQVCGRPPVIAETGWAAGYMLPTYFDYNRQRYTTHDRFIFGGTVYYCSAADAEAHGLHAYP